MEKNIYLFLEYQLVFSLVGIGYWLIKNRLGATTKRFTLLSLPIVALLIIWFNNTSLLLMNYMPAVIQLDPVTVTPGFENSDEAYATSFFFILALFVPPLCAIIYRFTKLSINLAKVHFKKDGLHYIGMYGTHSYSFFNHIVLELGLNEEEERTILEHEKIHGTLKHSVDVIVYEIYALILWINPIYHLLKSDLKMTHEQEVDAFMFQKHGKQYINLLLNKTFGTSSISYVLTNQFYDASKLKKRISIMKEKSKNRWALLLIIPVLGVSAALVSFKDTDMKEEVAKEMVLGDQFENASFKGGMSALIAYFQKNIKYPKKAEKDNIQGKVMVGFTVNKDGSIADVNIKKSENNIFNAEAIRVVKSMPNWIPATKDGKAVASQMVLPIMFKL